MESPFGVLEIQGCAALVPMQVLEVGPVSRPAEISLAQAFRCLDHEHVGPPIGQLPSGRRSSPDPGEIEHL